MLFIVKISFNYFGMKWSNSQTLISAIFEIGYYTNDIKIQLNST